MRPTDDIALNLIREIELHHYEIAMNHYEVKLKLQRLRDLWVVKSPTHHALPTRPVRDTHSTIDLNNVLPVSEVFEGLPKGTPTGKWMTGSEARAHYLKCCNLADNDPSAPAVWAKASHDIQKRWGPRQKNSVVRYAVKKLSTIST